MRQVRSYGRHILETLSADQQSGLRGFLLGGPDRALAELGAQPAGVWEARRRAAFR